MSFKICRNLNKKKWRGRESNPRQRAYESPALATELPRRSTVYIILESAVFVNQFTKICDFFIFYDNADHYPRGQSSQTHGFVCENRPRKVLLQSKHLTYRLCFCFIRFLQSQRRSTFRFPHQTMPVHLRTDPDLLWNRSGSQPNQRLHRSS